MTNEKMNMNVSRKRNIQYVRWDIRYTESLKLVLNLIIKVMSRKQKNKRQTVVAMEIKIESPSSEPVKTLNALARMQVMDVAHATTTLRVKSSLNLQSDSSPYIPRKVTTPAKD